MQTFLVVPGEGKLEDAQQGPIPQVKARAS